MTVYRICGRLRTLPDARFLRIVPYALSATTRSQDVTGPTFAVLTSSGDTRATLQPRWHYLPPAVVIRTPYWFFTGRFGRQYTPLLDLWMRPTDLRITV